MTKNDFYRYCRLVHGWLSALAFIALLFFAFTGLLLNHPEWFSGTPAKVVKQTFTLSADEIGQLRSASDPARVLVGLALAKTELRGELGEQDSEGSLVGNDMFVRMRGVRGSSFLRADLRSGALETTVESTSALTTLNELHRAERAGKSWRLAVDVLAVALMVLSVIGYCIFLSMRGSRLRTAILLTLGSTLGLGALFFYAVV